MSNEVKWFQYEMINYQSFMRQNTIIKDKPFIIFHIEKHNYFDYLKNRYKLVLELYDTDSFISDTAYRYLNSDKYPSKVIDFLGYENDVETYYMKDGLLACNLYRISAEKKIN